MAQTWRSRSFFFFFFLSNYYLRHDSQKDAAGPALGCLSASCFWNRGGGAQHGPSLVAPSAQQLMALGLGQTPRRRDSVTRSYMTPGPGRLGGHTAVCRWYGTDEHVPNSNCFTLRRSACHVSCYRAVLPPKKTKRLDTVQPCALVVSAHGFHFLCKDLVEHMKSCLY